MSREKGVRICIVIEYVVVRRARSGRLDLSAEEVSDVDAILRIDNAGLQFDCACACAGVYHTTVLSGTV